MTINSNHLFLIREQTIRQNMMKSIDNYNRKNDIVAKKLKK